MEVTGIDTVRLINGVQMPLIGMGTFPMNGLQLASFIPKAVKAGVTSIDTAAAYQNERWVGWGLMLSSMKKEELFITTKLSNGQQRQGNVKAAFKQSLRKMSLRYVDLYLMHWPNPDTYLSCWKQIEELYKEGLVRAIGVCNFHQHHFEELFKVADIKPMVNQVELHPLLTQKPLCDYCRKHDIQVEAYSPLARMDEKLICNFVLTGLAEKYDKSVPQIILRWNYQKKIPAVPKSSRIERIQENISIFDFSLTDDEVSAIDSINEDYRVRHDPDNCDFMKL